MIQKFYAINNNEPFVKIMDQLLLPIVTDDRNSRE